MTTHASVRYLAESRDRIRTAHEEAIGWQGFIVTPGNFPPTVWETFASLTEARRVHRGNRKIEVRFCNVPIDADLAWDGRSYRCPDATPISRA